MVDYMADKELLSAFIDGETVNEALITELEQDINAQETWKHYHLIGDVVRGETPVANWDIAESVAAALETEPAHTQVENNNKVESNKVETLITESQPTPQQSQRYIPAWLTQLGQVAVAASVSLFVVLGVQQYGGSSTADPASEQLPVLTTVPFAGNVEPVSLTRERMASQASDTQLAEHRRRINAMLQDYELQLRLISEKTPEDGLKTESVTE